MAKESQQAPKKDATIAYLVLAFGITWLFWGIGLTLNQTKGYLLLAPGNFIALFQNGFQNSEHIIISIIFALATYGPLFAVIYAIRIEKGEKGLAKLWKTTFSVRIKGVWFLRAIVMSLVISAIPFLVAVLTGLIPDPGSFIGSMLPYVLPLFVWQLLSSGLGEEPGWRGYLLRKLQGRLQGNKPVWILGLIWAIWHYPFTIYWTLKGMTDVEGAAMLVALVLSLAGFTISTIGITHLHVWLYNNTGSVFLAILFHALNNVFPTILSLENAPQLAVLVGFMPWVVVIYLERRLGKDQFPGPIVAAN